jgi:hemoglobin/transferrin/lactoferrin receptor protein
MRKYVLLVGLLFFSLLCFAQSKDSVFSLKEVIVTATRKETPIQRLPFTTIGFKRVTTQELGFRTTPEMLMTDPGVFVQKTNHGGGSPFVRGLTGNQSLIMIDGIRFNNATFRFGPNQYMNTIDAFTLDRLEVVKGSGSVQYGSDALGGVIQVLTKDPVLNDRRISGKVFLRGMSQDMEYTGRSEIMYSDKKIALLGGVTLRKFGDLYGGDTTGKQTPSGYNEFDYDLKMKWQVADKILVTAAHQKVKQTNVPLYHRVRLENFAYYLFDPQERQMSYIKTDFNFSSKTVKNIRFIVSHQRSNEVRSYYRNGNANRFLEQDKVFTTGATADVNTQFTRHWSANSGIEYYFDKVNSRKEQITVSTGNSVVQRGLYPDGATSGNFSIYSLHHFQFKKVRLEAGLRFNTLSITIPDTSTSQIKLGDITVSPSSFVFNAGISYELNNNSQLYVSSSSGYRAPNIDDMGTLGLVDFRYEIPAYNLKPEASIHTEFGYRFTSEKVKANVSIFYMHLSDLITRVQLQGQQIGGYNVYTKENSQESFIRGAEFSGSVVLNKSFSLHTGMAYAYGQNTSRNEPMRRIPPVNGKFQIQYNKGRFSASIDQFFAGKQGRLAQGDKDDNRIPLGGTPGWHVLNLVGGYTYSSHAIRVGLMNLANTDYRTHGSGINNTGRSIWLSYELNF